MQRVQRDSGTAIARGNACARTTALATLLTGTANAPEATRANFARRPAVTTPTARIARKSAAAKTASATS